MKELVNLVKVAHASKDALVGEKANIRKLVEFGVVTMALKSLGNHETTEEATALLTAIAK